MSNIVIFGSTQVGKTTLAGFLASQNYSDDLFDREARSFKKKIFQAGISEFHKEMILPCFISIDKDELLDFVNLSAIGTTKRVHRKRISISLSENSSERFECIFIDTPGTRTKLSEKYRGIFEGDIGIYVVSILEIEKMIELKTENPVSYEQSIFKLVEPFMFWCTYKSPETLIIALSKIDMVDDDYKRIENAIEIVRNCIFYRTQMNISIVPIGIEIVEHPKFSRISYNIIKRMNGFEKSFIQVLSEMIPQKEIPEYSIGFASVDRIAKIKDVGKSGSAIRIKVLEGEFKIGEKVIFGPVYCNKELDDAFMIIGEIKSLKPEDKDVVEIMHNGTIGGVVPTSMRIYEDGRRVRSNLEEIKVLKTSVVAAGDILTGSAISLVVMQDEISADDSSTIRNMLPKEQVSIYWFGKRITLDLIEKYEYDSRIYLTLAPLSSNVIASIGYFAIPANAKGKCVETMISVQNADYEYESAEIRHRIRFIEARVETLRNYLNDDITIRIYIYGKEMLYYDLQKNVNQEYDEKQNITSINISCVSKGSLQYILKDIRNRMRNCGIVDYSMKIENRHETF